MADAGRVNEDRRRRELWRKLRDTRRKKAAHDDGCRRLPARPDADRMVATLPERHREVSACSRGRDDGTVGQEVRIGGAAGGRSAIRTRTFRSQSSAARVA
jgi:hypothetical protein